MKELLLEVQAAVAAEYKQASEKFGPANRSSHESYAVIKEEFEEAKDAAKSFKYQFSEYWKMVKSNEPKNETDELLTYLQHWAEQAAAEWIQAATMCYKARVPYQETEEHEIHARWIYWPEAERVPVPNGAVSGAMICSNCGEKFKTDCHKHPACISCGAIMDGDAT